MDTSCVLCSLPTFILAHMGREQEALVSGGTSPTHCAGGVGVLVFTFRRAGVQLVHTLQSGFGTITGVRRPSGGKPLERGECGTYDTCPDYSRTILERVLQHLLSSPRLLPWDEMILSNGEICNKLNSVLTWSCHAMQSIKDVVCSLF